MLIIKFLLYSGTPVIPGSGVSSDFLALSHVSVPSGDNVFEIHPERFCCAASPMIFELDFYAALSWMYHFYSAFINVTDHFCRNVPNILRSAKENPPVYQICQDAHFFLSHCGCFSGRCVSRAFVHRCGLITFPHSDIQWCLFYLIFNDRRISRSVSRFLMLSRLSWAFFPRAIAISSFRFRPLLYTEIGIIVKPLSLSALNTWAICFLLRRSLRVLSES